MSLYQVVKVKVSRNLEHLKLHVFLTSALDGGDAMIFTPWPECAIELYRPSDRRLSAKLMPTFTDRRCHVVSVTDSYGRILGFLDLEML
jgi:hypothetical protein